MAAFDQWQVEEGSDYHPLALCFCYGCECCYSLVPIHLFCASIAFHSQTTPARLHLYVEADVEWGIGVDKDDS